MNDSVLYLIPARYGSKGLPGKNMAMLNGKPLVQYTIECALELSGSENICLSTDDESIIRLSEKLGLPIQFRRPGFLSGDDSSQFDVINHALDFYSGKGKEYGTIVFLQPTSPLRKPEHIREALELYTSDIDMVISVRETSSNPYFVLFEENEEGFLEKVKKGNFTRRQDCPKVWEVNGACYVINRESMKKYNSLGEFSRLRKHVMDHKYSIDIDGQEELDFAEFLITRYKL